MCVCFTAHLRLSTILGEYVCLHIHSRVNLAFRANAKQQGKATMTPARAVAIAAALPCLLELGRRAGRQAGRPVDRLADRRPM